MHGWESAGFGFSVSVMVNAPKYGEYAEVDYAVNLIPPSGCSQLPGHQTEPT